MYICTYCGDLHFALIPRAMSPDSKSSSPMPAKDEAPPSSPPAVDAASSASSASSPSTDRDHRKPSPFVKTTEKAPAIPPPEFKPDLDTSLSTNVKYMWDNFQPVAPWSITCGPSSFGFGLAAAGVSGWYQQRLYRDWARTVNVAVPALCVVSLGSFLVCRSRYERKSEAVKAQKAAELFARHQELEAIKRDKLRARAAERKAERLSKEAAGAENKAESSSSSSSSGESGV